MPFLHARKTSPEDSLPRECLWEFNQAFVASLLNRERSRQYTILEIGYDMFECTSWNLCISPLVEKAITTECWGLLYCIVHLSLSRYSLYRYHLKQGLSTGPHCNNNEPDELRCLRTARQPGLDCLCEDSDMSLAVTELNSAETAVYSAKI